MKTSYCLIFAVAQIFLCLFGCNGRHALSSEQREIIVREINQTLHRYYGDIRQYGLTAEFQYPDNSSDFYWIPPGYSFGIPYDSVVTVINENALRFKLVSNVWDTLRIVVISNEYAVYSGRLRSTVTDTAGMTSVFALVESDVLVKRDTRWKLLSGQTSVLNDK